MKKITKPKQAASPRTVDSWQNEVRIILSELIKLEMRVEGLLDSIEKTERR